MVEIKLIRHFIASFVIIATLIILVKTQYVGIQEEYGITDEYRGANNSEAGNVMESLSDLNIVQSLGVITKGLNSITTPSNDIKDVVGALLVSAAGVLGLIYGVITLPFQIISIITIFYPIPGAIITMVVTMTLIYLGFIYISAKMRGDV